MMTQQHKLLFVAMALGDLLLVLVWTLREAPPASTIVSPVEAHGVGEAIDVHAVARTDARSASESAAPAALPIRAPASKRTRAPVAAPSRVRLQGTVLGLTGHPLILSELEISATSESGEVVVAHPNLRPDYVLSNLHAGRWTIAAQAEHCFDLEVSVDLRSDETVHELDLVLQDLDELCVRWATPDGQSLTSALRAARIRVELSAVATADAPTNPLPAELARELPISSSQRYRDLSAAAKRSNRAAARRGEASAELSTESRAPASESFGVLTRDDPSLAYVSAVLGDRVLRTERVAAAQREVTFTIGVDEVRGALTGVRLTVVDAISGEPIANARVTIDDTTASSDANGVVVIDQVVTGLRSIAIYAPRYKNVRREESIAPGRRNELGQYALAPIASLRR